MRSTLIIGTLSAALLAASCATKSGTGTAIGAGAGGVLGYAVGGTTGLVIGAAAGGLLGYSAGKKMDDEDRRRAAIALEQDRAARWRNAETGYEYTIEPTRSRSIDGRQCKDFRMLAEVDGEPEELTGTACRRPDGTWEQVET